MMDKAVDVAEPEEGMVVAPGHEVHGTEEVDHRVGWSSQVLTVARAVYSMVLVGEDEMDYEFLV